MATVKRQEEFAIIKELNEILNYVRPEISKNATIAETNCGLHLSSCDEVYRNLYIGDSYAAKNKIYLNELGITHVVNTAQGKLLGMVDTDANYYKYSGIQYLGLSITDLPVTNITKYFAEVSEFIHKALENGGKVLVHCLMGLSRSSTCVLAYLMIKRGMSAAEALTTVRRCRLIYPNSGFLQQLAELDIKLKKSRYGIPVIDVIIPKRERKLVLPFRTPPSQYTNFERTITEHNPTWLPSGRCMSFRPSTNMFKIHRYK